MSKNLGQRQRGAIPTSPRQPEPLHTLESQAELHSVEFSSYSGPLPHPEILREFEQIVPGSAQLIFVQFEQQSLHRRNMEAQVISSGAFSQRVGSISASVIGLLGVGGGLWLAHEGKSVSGLTSLIGTLAGLVGTFLYQKVRQERERANKQRSQKDKK